MFCLFENIKLLIFELQKVSAYLKVSSYLTSNQLYMFLPQRHDAHSQECQSSLAAVQDALYVLNGKWKLPIIIALSEGKTRFNEIQKNVAGIAPKVLSAELKTLELNGFVVREVFNEFPVLIEYKLTEYSNSLEPVITALRDWGLKHKDKIKAEYKNKKKVAA
jgi:DNA-binding HxlR family transcriptional regulator